MEFLIVTPPDDGVLTGNRCTAAQWAEILSGLGHTVVTDGYGGHAADVLVLLHGAKGRAAIAPFRARCPEGRVVAALTGTDIYPEPSAETIETLRLADRIVALQPRARGTASTSASWATCAR